MRILLPHQNIPLAEHYELQAGVAYIYTNRQTTDIERLAHQRYGVGSITVDPLRLECKYREYEGEDLTGKKLFIWRTGGAGDLIQMKVAIQEAKRRYPDCHIVLCCEGKYMGLFAGDPHIDELRPYPVRLDWLNDADYHLCFEAFIEQNEDAKRMNEADLFLNKFGYRNVPHASKVPILGCSTQALSDIDELLLKCDFRPDDLIVAIQLIVAAPIRRYPPAYLAVVGSEMARSHGAKILWLGSPSQEKEIDEMAIKRYNLERNSINLSAHCPTWQHTIAALARADVLLSPDSGSIHVAGSQKVIVGPDYKSEYRFGFDEARGLTHTPICGIYGPILSYQRLAYFRHAVGIDSDVICAGCNQHGYASCRRGFPSPCFQPIEMSYVLNTTMRLVEWTNKLRPNPKPLKRMEPYKDAVSVLREEEAKERLKWDRAPNYMAAILRGEM